MAVEQDRRERHALDNAKSYGRGGEAGTILGVAAMNNSGKITLNYVSPDARFREVSTALMQRLEARARALGLRECVLETTQTALRFYQGLGYVKSEESYPLSLTGSPATVLRKSLR
jgi:N-acetylglutamate synthase-like GNAT family acetyltransferase